MKKSNLLKGISFVLFLTFLVVLTPSCVAFPEAEELSDYELYYPQYVDTSEPLSVIQQKDVDSWSAADISHPLLKESPSQDRVDYFDISYGTDAMQKLDIHHLKGNMLRPVIFYIHGGGWSSLDKDTSRYAAPTWISLGYTVVSINHRLAPQDPHPAQIEDCARALKWVIDNIHRYGGDPNKIAIAGLSSGGHLTALLATDTKWQKKYKIDMHKIKCWIPVSGIYDFNLPETWYHPWMLDFNNALLDDLSKKDDASPVNHITGKEPPCLIVHGGDDWLVPRTNATEFYDKLKRKGVKVQLKIVKGYWHGNSITDYGNPGHVPTELINKFLAKYLPTRQNNTGC